MEQKSNLRFLLEVSGREKFKLYLAAILSVVSSLLAVVPYIFMYYIILELFQESVDFEKVKSLVIAVSVIVAARMVVLISSGVFSHVAAFTILYELRMKAVRHMSKLHMGFFKERTIGNMKKTINEDIEKLENFLAHQIPDLASAIVTPLFILAYLIYLDWKLALVLFIPIILGIIVQSVAFKDMKQRMAKYHQLLNNLNSTIIQYINGMNVMKAFNLSAKSFKNYKETTKEYADYWVEITKKTAPAYSIFLSLIDSGLLFIIPIGGVLFLNGSIDASAYVLFLILSANFLTSFKTVLEFGGEFSMLLEGAGEVRKIIEHETQVDGNLTFTGGVEGKIEFQNVHFKYDKNEVFHNLSLTIEPQSTVALVGPSGSGKTTLGLLLGRFWDINNGKISIDGIDIKDIQMKELMDKVSFVFQDVFMLNDSILENIKMGSTKSIDEVMEASKKAQIHDFIMSLPDGYDTLLGEDGIKLSGGEKQRISIARAILKNSPIVVLDEVTSYSDIENESKIQEALRSLLKGKTAIIIAHRLYTIKNADQIVVLKEGEIVEKGHHYSLMKKEGLYQTLWDMYEYELVKEGRGA
ncbi:ABC transporter permease [Bacillaceae bacterium SAS-127]|nr:ABC transporter permease [Bacillaceae bacterium SAS-127]